MLRTLLFITFLSAALPLEARWAKVAQMTVPVGCGYFINKDTGLIGSGQLSTGGIANDRIFIWRTTDGGTTWVQSITPSDSGRITAISMLDELVGYAAVYSRYESLWSTNDGGISWQDITGAERGSSTCVYVTKNAVIKTMWGGINRGLNFGGGFSTDQGKTFSYVFTQQFGEISLNGIDFANDTDGIVSPGPGAGTTCYLTSDGGLTWRSGGNLDESWGVYGRKGTREFYMLPEGEAVLPKNTLHISTDAGETWNIRHSFPTGLNFTGHIAGKAGAIYLQSTGSGMYRSDDFGLTWKSVGGPQSKRDTRFCVCGCLGQVVYAFDIYGGVYRTADGGDSTLFETSGPAALAVNPDSLSFIARDCNPVRQYVSLVISQCSELTLDSLSIISGTSAFSLDTSDIIKIGTLPILVPVLFQDTSSIGKQGYLHLVGHNGTQIIDTLIPLYGKNTTDTKLFIDPDSAFIWTFYCQPKSAQIKLSSLPCTELSVDAMYIETGAGEFTLLSGSIPSIDENGKEISIGFQFDKEAVRYGSLRIKCSRNGTVIDTLIPLTGKNATAPEPLVGAIQSVIAGDTTVIPVYLKATQDTFSISLYTLHLSYNKDLLSPITFDITNTLSTPIINAGISEDAAGLTFTCQTRNVITNGAAFTQPLIKFLMRSYLSGVTSTSIRLDTFSITSGAPLPLCSMPQETYVTMLACGDSILSTYMFSGAMPKFTSIRPNPVRGGELEVAIFIPETMETSMLITDAGGKTVAMPFAGKIFPKGSHAERIDIHSLASGVYTLRLLSKSGEEITERFVVAK